MNEPASTASYQSNSYTRPLGAVIAVGVLVAVPCVALLWVSSYARETPRLWGVPFFYWYQFLWVFIAAVCTSLAYWIVTATSPRRRDRS